MTDLLSRWFIRDRERVGDPRVRRAYGTMSSVVGILANVLLAAFKLLAGILSGSIAIVADAANNLSDAGSQVISFISFKISAKPADRDHPFGHARIEYVASMIVAFLVLTVGLELLGQSIEKIFSPEPTVFNPVVVVILAISVLVKLWLFFFNRKVAGRIDSSVMRATAIDSLSDAGATAAVLASILIGHFTNVETDAYMGVLVAGLILWAAIQILNETKNSILGSAPDPAVVEGVLAIAGEFPEVLGVHDMVIHNYGPGNTIASLHAEVDGAENVFDTHDVIDNLERRLYAELGVRATVHMDPIVTDDEKVNALRQETAAIVSSVDARMTIHDFRYVEGKTHSNLIFDVSVPFECKMTDEEIRRAISGRIGDEKPNCFAVMTIDRQ